MLSHAQMVAAIEKGIANARRAREPITKSAPPAQTDPRRKARARRAREYRRACAQGALAPTAHLIPLPEPEQVYVEPEPDPAAEIVKRIEALSHDLVLNSFRVDVAVRNAVDRAVRNQPRQPDVLELLLETEQPESEPEPNPALQKAAETEAAYHRACDAYEDAVLRDGRERTPDSYQASLDAYEAMLIAKRALHT